MKINILLSDGLGNQMFQFAFGKMLEKKYNSELFFEYKTSKVRKYMLDIFEIFEKKIDKNIKTIDKSYYGSYKNDSNLPYNFLDKNNNYTFSGYFQNENYFLEISEEIRNIFFLKNSIEIKEDYLIVQVRRTDYVNNKNFLVCDLDWYNKAINEFEDINKVIFISDDLNWCISNFHSNKKEYVFLDLNERDTLALLQHSRNIIISNSSFAWWGAWLSKSQNVICPKTWFLGDLSWDLGVKNWKKL